MSMTLNQLRFHSQTLTRITLTPMIRTTPRSMGPLFSAGSTELARRRNHTPSQKPGSTGPQVAAGSTEQARPRTRALSQALPLVAGSTEQAHRADLAPRVDTTKSIRQPNRMSSTTMNRNIPPSRGLPPVAGSTEQAREADPDLQQHHSTHSRRRIPELWIFRGLCIRVKPTIANSNARSSRTMTLLFRLNTSQTPGSSGPIL